MSPPDPYRRAGLERNPFCHDVVAATFIDRGVGPAPEPRQRLFVQLVGVKGAGKTTQLGRWRAEHAGPHHWVPPSRGRWRRLPVAPIAYWDEIDRAPVRLVRSALRRASAAGATVVAGTHLDLGHLADDAGLDVRTHDLPALTPAEVRRWAMERLRSARLPGTDRELLLEDSLADDVARDAGGSWRVAGDLMHAWVARQVATAMAGGNIDAQEVR
ncbi:MAG: hypothetical protein KDB21_19120 [Acidimicrobiales bacterium]|nr:hypothetical protein [Acidimicrobiales bacterium]